MKLSPAIENFGDRFTRFALPRGRGAVFLLLLAFAALLRAYTFRFSVMDWDETTYLLMGREVLTGSLPYVSGWDLKPPGIYFLFALISALFPDPILGMRLTGTLAVAGIGFFLFVLLNSGEKAKPSAFLAGFLMVFSLCVWDHSLSVNTELFYGFFITLGAAALFRFPGRARFPLCGIFFGLAFLVNTIAGTAFAAAFLYAVILRLGTEAPDLRPKVPDFLTLLGGFALPLALVTAVYLAAGQMEALHFTLAEFPTRYVASAPPLALASFLLQFVLQFPLSAAGAAAGFAYQPRMRLVYEDGRLLWFLILWLTFAIAGTSLSGNYYGHYLIHPAIPLTGLAGLGLKRIQDAHAGRTAVLGAGCLILAAFVILVTFYKLCLGSDYFRPDTPRSVSRAIEERIRPGDGLYIANYPHIAYLLTGTLPPTRYRHPSVLYEAKFIQCLDLDPAQEIGRIFAQGPRFVVVKSPGGKWPPDFRQGFWRPYDPRFRKSLAATLSVGYEILARFPDGAILFERAKRAGNTPSAHTGHTPQGGGKP